MGGTLVGTPAGASWSNTRADVFAEGSNAELYQLSWTDPGGWSNWGNVNSTVLSSSPGAVATCGTGRLDVVADLASGGIGWSTGMAVGVRGSP